MGSYRYCGRCRAYFGRRCFWVLEVSGGSCIGLTAYNRCSAICVVVCSFYVGYCCIVGVVLLSRFFCFCVGVRI